MKRRKILLIRFMHMINHCDDIKHFMITRPVNILVNYNTKRNLLTFESTIMGGKRKREKENK
jgi:hypothetical protein